MKTYSVPLGRRGDYPHPAPERTAIRSSPTIWVDDFYQVWPNRESMARSIRMQERGPWNIRHWKAMIPLKDGEGY